MSTPGEGQREADLLAVVYEECWDVRCFDMPSGADDSDVEWRVISHHMTPPREREIGVGATPQKAIIDAMANEGIHNAGAPVTEPASEPTDADVLRFVEHITPLFHSNRDREEWQGRAAAELVGFFRAHRAAPATQEAPSAPAAAAFNPLSHLPGEYDAGRLIRGACEYDADKGRFYLTCSIGELAQRIAAALSSPSAPAEPLEALTEADAVAVEDMLVELSQGGWKVALSMLSLPARIRAALSVSTSAPKETP